MTNHKGFTLIEMLLGASIMSIVLIALIGAYLGQGALNTHARNLTLAMNDATRVMEAIRQQNVGTACTARGGVPAASPPTGTSWNTWLADQNGGGGKSIGPSSTYELVAVTCQDGSVLVNPGKCGDLAQNPFPAQIGSGEWAGGLQHGINTRFDPIRVTVSIGWREGRRVMGTNSAGQLELTFTRAWWLQPQTALRRLARRLDRVLAPVAEASSGGGSSGGGSSGGGSTPPPPQWGTTDLNDNGVIDSQAMLTTIITCR